MAVLATVALTACGLPGPSDVAHAESVVLADGTSADRYGTGSYGVLIIPALGESAADWQPLAEAIATNRMIVLVLEKPGLPGRAQATSAGREWLLGDGSAERVAVVASGFETFLGATNFDQLVAISADIDAGGEAGLGVEPKLFLAAEGDPATAAAALRLAEESPGDWNLAAFVPGSAVGSAILDGPGSEDLISAIVARLNERR